MEGGTLSGFQDVIDGESPEPEDALKIRGGRHNARNRGRLAGPSVRTLVIQAVYSMLFLLVAIGVMHLGWMYGGNSLDTIRTQETIARNAGFKDVGTTTEMVSTSRIAAGHTSDVPADTGSLGEGGFVGWMYIPRFGADWKRAIQQGTDKVVLDNMGLGHYPDTAMPGSVGNSSYAGHRSPGDLGYADQLKAGDPIIIQTKSHWYVYQVEKTWITHMSDVGVLDAPGGDARMLTLTTCDPMFSPTPATERLIVHASFAYWANVSDGVPRDLAKYVEKTTPVKSAVATVNRSVRTISRYAPVSNVLCVAFAAVWLILLAVCWMVWRSSRPARVRSGNVFILLWRLQCGPVGVRVVLFALMWIAVLFGVWTLVSPWLDGLVNVASPSVV